MSDAGDDPALRPTTLPEGEIAVRIMDLSGANGADPVETVRGFATVEHANAFARRYVRDSLERCREAGMSPQAVIDTWFAFGEDAEVAGAGDAGWRSAAELDGFARHATHDSEERNWRVLDPRRHEDEDAEDDGA